MIAAFGTLALLTALATADTTSVPDPVPEATQRPRRPTATAPT